MSDGPYIATSWPKRLTHLKTVATSMRKAMESDRANRRALMKQYVGKYFGKKGSSDKIPKNLLNQAVVVWMANLVSRSPQVMVTSRYRELMPQAADLARVLNPLLEHELKFGRTLTQGTFEALFSPFSMIKTGVCRRSKIEVDGYMHDFTQPFADVVDLDDAIVDLAAKRDDLVTFVGNNYSLPYQYVMESGDFKNTDQINAPNESKAVDDIGQPLMRGVGKEGMQARDEWYPQVEVTDMWLPQENLVCTFLTNGDWSKPLDQREWEGPEEGPYDFLKFVDVPGESILGNSPLGLILDLHEIANKIYMKLARRGMNSKHIVGYSGSMVKASEKVRDAADMEFLKLDNAGALKELVFGNADMSLFGMVEDALSTGKTDAGNLDTLGGLAPGSDTLGQDRLMSANASKRMAAMQGRVSECTRSIVSKIAFYVWDDARNFPVTVTIPGTDKTITYSWGPEHREGDFLQYNFDIAPYSMVQQTPSEKLASVLSIYQNILMPMAQTGQLQARGKAIDIDGLLDVVGQYSGLKSELSRVLIDTMPSAMPEQPMGKPSTPIGAKVTNRITRNVDSGGKKRDQVTQMMGGRLNRNQEMASSR